MVDLGNWDLWGFLEISVFFSSPNTVEEVCILIYQVSG